MENDFRKSGTISFFLVFFWIIVLIPFGLKAQSGNLTGLWLSSFGHINIKMQKGNISGDYFDGQVKGTLKGHFLSDRQLLAGNWNEGNIQGRFIFKILPGTNSFSGRWWENNSQNGGEWIAVRMDKPALANSVSAADYAGDWDTNFGRMRLEVDGQKISGAFKGKAGQGTIEGTVDEKANQLNARWSDDKYRGTLKLSMLKGKNGFHGEWWFSDKTYGGAWYGVRSAATIACISGDCIDDEGIFLWPDGSRYEGQWRDRHYHGIGVIYNLGGEAETSGLWADGIFQGTPISGDCRNGEGKLTLPGGDVYEGNFKDCELTGKGKFIYQNGDIYEGDVIKGVAAGMGTYTWTKQEDSYTGSFRNGVIHGRGVYTFKNGDKFEGKFFNGKAADPALFTWASGDRYEGSWKDDKAEGEGIYHYRNGDTYRGNFSEGLKSGKGTYTFAKGKTVPAIWEKDRISRVIPGTAGQGSPENDYSIADFLTEKNNSFPEIKTAGQTSRPGYFIYKIQETEPDVLADSASAGSKKIVEMQYHVVYTPENLEESALRTYLENNANANLDNYKIEQTLNPEARIQQILQRYLYGVSDFRLRTSGRYYRYPEDDIAVLRDSAKDNVTQ